MPTPKKDTSKAAEEVQSKVDEAEDKGYIGWSPDPEAGKKHSLLTGPDSPPLVPDDRTGNVHHSLPKDA